MTSPILFQFLPPLAPDEYAALETSIREHGVQVPIVLDEAGVVIDGHHRQAIARSLGVRCPQVHVYDKTATEKRTLALTLNLDRRNLSREQRRAIVEASVKADPQLSDRAHAKRTGVSPTTVGAVRAHVSNLDTSPAPTIDLATGEVLDTPETRLDAAMGALSEIMHGAEVESSKVTGLDGKKYSRPEPKTPRRPALPDSFMTATISLTQKVESIVRLSEDDRFRQNVEKVALANRSDLIRAIDALQRVVDQLPERNLP